MPGPRGWNRPQRRYTPKRSEQPPEPEGNADYMSVRPEKRLWWLSSCCRIGLRETREVLSDDISGDRARFERLAAKLRADGSLDDEQRFERLLDWCDRNGWGEFARAELTARAQARLGHRIGSRYSRYRTLRARGVSRREASAEAFGDPDAVTD